jgi:PHD/YefM family antitoxin component YafN of YafNO toxin-antitoxin module
MCYNFGQEREKMQTLTISQARSNLYQLGKAVTQKYQSVIIRTKTGPMLLSPLENISGWRETAYLESIPGLVDGIIASRRDKKDVGVLMEKLDWEDEI